MACSTGDVPDSGAPEETFTVTMALPGSEWNFGDGSEAFVAFKLEGRVIGSGGCNNFSGSFTQDGKAIKIGPLASTRKMCPPDIMNVETKLLKILDQARYVEASHLKMSLMDENQTLLAKFQRSDWD